MPRARSNLSRKTSRTRNMFSQRRAETEEQRRTRLSQVAQQTANRREQETNALNELRQLQSRVENAGSRHRAALAESQQVSTENRFAFNYNPQFDYINLSYLQIGKMDKVCNNCNAKKWKDEPAGLCCAGGKVMLSPHNDLPDLIKRLVIGSHPLSKHFLSNSRQYNTLFQMTSFGANVANEAGFMPTFKIKGQVHHRIGSLLPPPGNPFQFLQIYFMGDDEQVTTRHNINSRLKPDLIELLQKELHDNNQLIRGFKYNLENANDLNNLKLVLHADHVPTGEHRGRYNAPTVNEVAVLIVDEEKGPRDIVLTTNNNQLQRISELHRSYDALQYPLLHFFGEDGYCVNIPQQNNSRKTVSCMQFYAYRFMIRLNEQNNFLFYKNLLNQYVVDVAAKMLSERLAYIRNNQKDLRAEEYIHLKDAVEADGADNPANIGQRVILPSSVTGSPRYMHEKAQDGMTYAREYGNADLFITFTCNKDWPEIKEALFQNQEPRDRYDSITRIFCLKLKKLMFFLTKKNVFGKSKADMCTVEWQKRGLPHAHILLWLEKKIQPDEIDKIISAELPDKNIDPLLFEIVSKSMVHGPCGDLNKNSPCMVDGKCSKRYPQKFINETQTGEDGYPSYRRRSPEDGGHYFILNLGGIPIQIDNRWIVPFSPVLSRSFNAHINVESCHSIKSIKYITKYINKGCDQATFSLQGNQDEVSQFLNGMYICSSQAFWRIFAFNIHTHHPAITHLAVHLENHQRIYFTGENARNILESPRQTTLTAFFELCETDNFAKTLLYREVAAYYTWRENKFFRRVRGEDVEGYPGIKKDAALGRVYTVHPSQDECFHLRLLLNNVRGPISFKFLKTVEGVLFETFKEACLALGLLENDDQWKKTLADAAISQSAAKMRDLFAIILEFCKPTQPRELWKAFQKDLCEDILYRKRQQTGNFQLSYSEEIFNGGLIELDDKVFDIFQKRLDNYGLPLPDRTQRMTNNSFNSNLRLEYDISELRHYVQNNCAKLVPDQHRAFESITDSVDNGKGEVFFLDAPGGTGKTWLINLLLAYVRSKGGIALAVASSGIAATLLSGGRTAHSTFKLPLNVTYGQDFFCSIRKNSPFGEILKKTKFIVWDECTMSHRAHSEAIDRTLRDIRSCNKPMGGVTFVFAGDFRQTLPVIPKGTRADIVRASLKSSPIWTTIKTLRLRTNMRAHIGGSGSEFPKYLLKIGDGKVENDDGFITVDEKIGETVRTVNDLISAVYPDISNLLQKPYTWLCERAILSPRNVTAEEINDIIMNKFEGAVKEYKAFDTVPADEAVNFPTEFLNSLTPSGFPPYNLKLKIGAPIMLLRNLNPPKLCNGTRLQVKVMRDNMIEAVILTGPAAGEIAFIPRIPMIPTDLPFQFKRVQYPIKVSFAITVTKSQGQTYNHVGVDLRTECFSHGQLYVAVTRTGNPKNQYFLLPSGNKTKNVIYSEIL